MEEKKDEEDGTLNEGEGVKQRLLFHMQRDLLTQGGVQASNIGIITPYVMQKWQIGLPVVMRDAGEQVIDWHSYSTMYLIFPRRRGICSSSCSGKGNGKWFSSRVIFEAGKI
ncbi:hypothetical protein SLEP1_g35093 [Rubroshorea leprosula]|uniref:DNA2/NAM7 helicase-like C-terminal domain-containing protein n=1 Tax=Rubroshorea leprosula TaxID=152421 RepID=A0AAV5KM41_9ROSI|nr:hypothetical protein SLEP1_g35093 [Rubroshorea leprosula]